MRLVDRKTKVEIKEGDEVERGRETMRVSGLDPKHGRIFLIDLEADRSPVALPPSAIGAEFAP